MTFLTNTVGYLNLVKKHIPGWLLVLGVLFASSCVFLDLASNVWIKEGFAWDRFIMLGIHNMSTPWLDVSFKWITFTAGKRVLIPVFIMSMWFGYRRQPVRIMLIFISYFGAFLLNSWLKSIFQRPRPDLFIPLVNETSYSFPSGHAAIAISVYGLFAILFWQDHRYLLAALNGVWVFLVALSRVYLGVHYPSDVVASLAIGIIWIILLLVISENIAKGKNIIASIIAKITDREIAV